MSPDQTAGAFLVPQGAAVPEPVDVNIEGPTAGSDNQSPTPDTEGADS